MLPKDNIRNISLIQNANFNYNNLSSHSILDLLDNNQKDYNNNHGNLSKNTIDFYDDEDNENDNDGDSVAELINEFEGIDVEQNKDLKYYIIENIKLLNLDKINKEIKNKITELKLNILTK